MNSPLLVLLNSTNNHILFEKTERLIEHQCSFIPIINQKNKNKKNLPQSINYLLFFMCSQVLKSQYTILTLCQPMDVVFPLSHLF